MSKQKASNAHKDLIQQLLDSGLGVCQIADELGMHHNNIRRTMSRYSLDIYIAFDEIDYIQIERDRLAEYGYEDYWDGLIRGVFLHGEAVLSLDEYAVDERKYLHVMYGGIIEFLLAKGYGRFRKYI